MCLSCSQRRRLREARCCSAAPRLHQPGIRRLRRTGAISLHNFFSLIHSNYLQVIAFNSEAKNAGTVLEESRDSYMLNPCNAPAKYIIVELCDEILVDSVHFANFEIFSSVISEVRISIADRFDL